MTLRDKRAKMIARINAGQGSDVDGEVSDALFLHRHPAFRPEDLGYPPGDAVIVDLMRLID